MSDEERKIYDQDCQFMRYQDGLLWSRLQTAALVEGGMLYGLYGKGLDLVPWEKGAVAVLGAFFVTAICLLMISDRTDAHDHKKRIQRFESDFPFVSSKPAWQKAPIFLTIAGVSLVSANLAVLIQTFHG